MRTNGAVMTHSVSERGVAQFTFLSLEKQPTNAAVTQEKNFTDMFLFYITASCILFEGSSSAFHYGEECYGGNYRLPFEYTPPVFRDKLYFTPTTGRSRRVVLDKGQAKDPRFKVSVGSVRFTDLRESDAGVFSVSFGDDDDALSRIDHNVIRLKILDCSTKISRYYGDTYSFDVSRLAEFLEYNPLNTVEQTKVLWNRTDPDAFKEGRGQLKRNAWRISLLTQADNGYYNFRAKDNTLLSRTRLTIQDHERYYDAKENDQLLIENPSSGSSWSVYFTPREETDYITLTRAGKLVLDDSLDSMSLKGRIRVVYDGIDINPVEITEAGTYAFKDSLGHLAQTVHVSVEREVTPTFVYVAVIAGFVFGVIILCCCVRKCCCKKSSSKRDNSAPAVHYRDQDQPAGPSHSAAPAGPSYYAAPAGPSHSAAPAGPSHSAAPAGPSYYAAPAGPSHSAAPAGPSYSAAPAQDYSFQPLYPTVPKEPETTSFGQSVAGPRGQGTTTAASLGSNFLSSDPEPKFYLKGVFSSAAPLSSDSSVCSVYNSDKLNFL